MSRVDRFTVSLDTELLAAFDRHIAAHGYENRSEAIRDLIRALLVTPSVDRAEGDAVALLTVLCEDAGGQTWSRVRRRLAEAPSVAATVQCIPVDDRYDALNIILRGDAKELRRIAEGVRAMRGLSHGHLWMAPPADAGATD
jgi:CopG family nickel-responsive transcriptional regulator